MELKRAGYYTTQENLKTAGFKVNLFAGNQVYCGHPLDFDSRLKVFLKVK